MNGRYTCRKNRCLLCFFVRVCVLVLGLFHTQRLSITSTSAAIAEYVYEYSLFLAFSVIVHVRVIVRECFLPLYGSQSILKDIDHIFHTDSAAVVAIEQVACSRSNIQILRWSGLFDADVNRKVTVCIVGINDGENGAVSAHDPATSPPIVRVPSLAME